MSVSNFPARMQQGGGMAAERQYRAEFDASVTFANGGGLRVDRFRVDLPGPDAGEQQVAELFLTSLGLLMVERVELTALRVFAEPHKGTRGGPSELAPPPVAAEDRVLVELSHPIEAGMVTYPGLPAPEIEPHLTREASREVYAPGTEFAMDWIRMIGNTGTYLDSPYHRYPDGPDLAGLPLAGLVDLPVTVVRTAGSTVRAVDVAALAAVQVCDRAVLLHTGGDRHWGTPAYAVDAPFLTEAGARWLVEHGALLVGIDSVNIDDIVSGGERPAHTLLLGAGIHVVEHLTNLGGLPARGARFTATPPAVEGFGTFPVRAFAEVPIGATG
jgi:arylformamidase